MKQNNDIIYSPKHNIPIGKASKSKSGNYSIEMKKAHSNIYEKVPLNYIIKAVMERADQEKI